jgi:hypothetical protein
MREEIDVYLWCTNRVGDAVEGIYIYKEKGLIREWVEGERVVVSAAFVR